MSAPDFVYQDCDSIVLLTARTQAGKEKVKKSMTVTQKFGPAIILDPQEALVIRHVLRREGFTVLTV